jgi:hypothetical protein
MRLDGDRARRACILRCVREVVEDDLGHALADRLTAAMAPHFDGWYLRPEGERVVAHELAELDDRERVALLKEVADRMRLLRASDADTAFRDGSIAYEAAVRLLRSPSLLISEADLVDLLGRFHHDCGHHDDTTSPFELAVRFQRQHGYSAAVSGALRDYVDRLPKTGTVKVTNLKRWWALLSVLDAAAPPVRVRGRVLWIETVRQSLAELPAEELEHWRGLVLSMSLREQHSMPATWSRAARPFIEALGPEGVARRLREWWPDPSSEQPISLDRGGIPLIKHLIWLFAFIPRADAEPLAISLADTEFHGRGEPLGALKPALLFLADSSQPAAVAARNRLQARVDAHHARG